MRFEMYDGLGFSQVGSDGKLVDAGLMKVMRKT